MKLKPHSIRFKFFSAINLVALMFIGILLLLNLFFYQDYFMMTRKSSLLDAFDTVCGSYDSDMDDIVTLLDSYEPLGHPSGGRDGRRHGAHLLPFLHDRGDHARPDWFGLNEQQFRNIAVLASVMQNETDPSLAEHQYRFANISLRDNDQYLCLIGSLDKGTRGPLPDRLYAVRVHHCNSSLNLVFPAHRRRLCAAHLSRHRVFFSREFTRPLSPWRRSPTA